MKQLIAYIQFQLLHFLTLKIDKSNNEPNHCKSNKFQKWEKLIIRYFTMIFVMDNYGRWLEQ